MIFMLFFYHWSGLNAIVALTVNLIVMLGLMGSFHAVITLPGIAGFALTIGMAVDANILIYRAHQGGAAATARASRGPSRRASTGCSGPSWTAT